MMKKCTLNGSTHLNYTLVIKKYGMERSNATGSRNAKFFHMQTTQQAIISALLLFVSALGASKEVFNGRSSSPSQEAPPSSVINEVIIGLY